MIVTITDFGLEGPYVGQMRAVIHRLAPEVPVVDLFADAPAHNPRATAYLLPPYCAGFPPGTVFLCVVDPGVGSHRHAPVMLRADEHWYVGPDNGLFELVIRRARVVRKWVIDWRPDSLSASFHGRDLYAPVAARLALAREVAATEAEPRGLGGWPDDLDEVIYIDRFGNAMTGIRAETVSASWRLSIHGHSLRHARTFADVTAGAAFWYGNSNGLVEIAANQGRADELLGIRLGDRLMMSF